MLHSAVSLMASTIYHYVAILAVQTPYISTAKVFNEGFILDRKSAHCVSIFATIERHPIIPIFITSFCLYPQNYEYRGYLIFCRTSKGTFRGGLEKWLEVTLVRCRFRIIGVVKQVTYTAHTSHID